MPTYLFQLIGAIVGSLSLIALQSPLEFFQPRVTLTSPANLLPSYDFIIIGGGISGCLMAKRLSDAGHTTLLIHGPGSLPNALSRAPLLNLGYEGNPDYDHMYQGPRLNSRWGNQTLTYFSGRDLGGSQLLSAQMWSYGKTGDFECWRKSFQISEKFSQEKIREAGKMHENAGPEISGDDYSYGTDGEIQISRTPVWDPFSRRFQDLFERIAADVTNTTVNLDQNADPLGFGKIVHAVEHDTGFISSPVRAFFEKGISKKLHIVTKHMVRRILFDTTADPPRATGVEFVQAEDRRGRNVFTKNATKKVILSAGAIRSPQLLTLSGVGSEADMKQWNVTPVVTREGVGQNLHDHYDMGCAGICFPEGTKNYSDLAITKILEFGYSRKGPLRSSLAVESYGFFKSQQNITTCDDPKDAATCRPDFELILQYLGQNTQVAAKHYLAHGISDSDLIQDFYLQGKNRSANHGYFDTRFNQRECLLMTPTLLHPEYRGQITLTSNDPLDKPIIDLKTTSNSRDMRLMGELWLMVRNISNQAFESLGGKFDDTPFRECVNISDTNSYEFGTCQVERYMKTAWHMAGSCRLGQENDTKAVVNENFHVIGVQDLVLVDASIIPCPTSGHMLPMISALAEMAAQELISLYKDSTN